MRTWRFITEKGENTALDLILREGTLNNLGIGNFIW